MNERFTDAVDYQNGRLIKMSTRHDDNVANERDWDNEGNCLANERPNLQWKRSCVDNRLLAEL